VSIIDNTLIVELVGTLGFPIVACVAMFRKMDKQDALHSQEMNKQDERHTLQIEKMSEAVNNNTIVVTRLLERMNTHE
jgi:hypothetical protein